MGRSLVGHCVGLVSRILSGTLSDFRKDISCVAEQTDRNRPPVGMGILHQLNGIVQIIGPSIQVSGPHPGFNRLHIAFDRDQ